MTVEEINDAYSSFLSEFEPKVQFDALFDWLCEIDSSDSDLINHVLGIMLRVVDYHIDTRIPVTNGMLFARDGSNIIGIMKSSMNALSYVPCGLHKVQGLLRSNGQPCEISWATHCGTPVVGLQIVIDSLCYQFSISSQVMYRSIIWNTSS